LHGGRLTSRYAVIPRLHAQQVLPMVQQVLEEAGVSMAEVDAIAFGRGPGAFTGLRIAVGVVQGLAFALDKPVLPVSSLAAIARRAWRIEGASQIAVAIDARMDEVYWGCYALEDGHMQLQGIEQVCAPEQACLPRSATGEWLAAGTGWAAYAGRINVPVYGHASESLPHAEDIAMLALHDWQQGRAVDAEQALPVYLRDQVATPKSPVA
jgi:tRNA threonylcarbamoyladenosine biosynthesis protein TsaB